MKTYLVFLVLIFSNFVCHPGLSIVGIGAEVVPISRLNPSFLHNLLKAGNIAAVQELIRKYPTCIESRNRYGETPLTLISYRYCLQQSEEIRLQAAQLLLDHGANVNTSETIFCNTPLHEAASHNINLVKLLLAAPKLDINIRNRFDETAFSIAIENNRVDIAELLMSAGADVYLNSGLWEAVRNCHIDAVKFLIKIHLECQINKIIKKFILKKWIK